MSEERIPVAILGAGGYIGQHFLRLLGNHPRFEPVSLVAGPRSEGKAVADLWQLAEEIPPGFATRKLERSTPARLARAGVRVAFGALPSGTAGAIESDCVRRGLSVFSNAADHRFDPDVPLLVPEVNAEHLRRLAPRQRHRGLLVTNPNCSTTGLVLALAPVLRALAPWNVHVATYQSLSGAGYPGVPSLAVTDNVVPFIRDEEEKIARESKRILGTVVRGRVRPLATPFLPHAVRVGVREGHLEAVTVQASLSPTRAELLRLWRTFDPLAGLPLPTAPHPPVLVRPEGDRPQPLRDRWAGSPATARGMAAVVGRIRWEPPFLRFFVLSHNAVRGGAGASVLNAELAESLDLLRPRRSGR